MKKTLLLASVAVASLTSAASAADLKVCVSWSNFREERWKTDEAAIKGALDAALQTFRVERVGRHSTIAKLWGVNPVSYPCLSGHSYDRAVSRIYPEVSRSGEPHYDHIYAAMASPRGEVVWVPYQRVVLPLHRGRSGRAVRIVTEVAKVDIAPL